MKRKELGYLGNGGSDKQVWVEVAGFGIESFQKNWKHVMNGDTTRLSKINVPTSGFCNIASLEQLR